MRLLDLFEGRIKRNINNGYSDLVKGINDCLGQILEITVKNASTIEEEFKCQLVELISQSTYISFIRIALNLFQ